MTYTHTYKLFEVTESGKRVCELDELPSFTAPEEHLVEGVFLCSCGAEIEHYFDGVECDPTFPHRRTCANGHDHTLYLD